MPDLGLPSYTAAVDCKEPVLNMLALAGLIVGLCGAGLVLHARRATARFEALIPPDGAYAEVDGARFHYVEQGAGPPIVMIHGISGQLRNFSYGLVARLADRHRVIIIDRPGSGYSTIDARRPSGIIGQAALIAALLPVLKVEKPLIVGHSLGGAVALALALDRPDAISGLALISPLTQQAAIPGLVSLMLRHGHWVWDILFQTIAMPAAGMFASHSRKRAFFPAMEPPDFRIGGGVLLAHRWASLRAAAFEIATIDRDLGRMIPRYADLRVPVALLFGVDDKVLDPHRDGAGFVDMVPGARLDLIEGGHMLPVTAPGVTANWIKAFGRSIW